MAVRLPGPISRAAPGPRRAPIPSNSSRRSKRSPLSIDPRSPPPRVRSPRPRLRPRRSGRGAASSCSSHRSGRFGVVYRARDVRLDRDVALKLLTRSTGANLAGNSVVAEGRLMARLRHPNVITVYGADVVDGVVGISMELLAGRTLEQELVDRGRSAPAKRRWSASTCVARLPPCTGPAWSTATSSPTTSCGKPAAGSC